MILIPKENLRNLYYNQNLNTYDIAKMYNCCQATIWKKFREFKIKLHPKGNPIHISKEELKDLYVNKRLSSRKISKIYGCAYSTIDRKIRNHDFRIRNRAESHIIYPRKNFDGNLTDKAYLIGFSIGDLRVRKIWNRSETINIDCGSTKEEQINLFSKLFSSYGHVWVSKPNNYGKRQTEVYLNMSFDFLLDKDTNWVFCSKKCFAAFLAGFVDAEGSFCICNKNAIFQIGNYNAKLLFKIQEKLSRLGIKCHKLYEDNRKGSLTKEGYTYNKNYWHLSASKKNSILEIIKLLKPYLKHEKRIKDMKIAELNILERNFKYGK
jgi:hypothetical protein